MYLELLKKYKEQFGFKLFSFMLGKEQISLLMEVGEGATISVIMHGVSSNYTKYFNSRYQRKGHLFQERFRSVVVEKEPYLLDLISYIHLSPAPNSADKTSPQSIYSSHLLYLYNNQNQDEAADKIRKILNLETEVAQVTEAILRACPDKKGYADFIAAFAPDELEAIRKKLHRTNILGSEQFVEKARLGLEKKAEPENQEKAFPFMPVSVSIVVMLAGIGLGVLYIQKNILRNKVQGYERNYERESSDSLMRELDGTEWQIQVISKEGKEDSDLISFTGGKFISSKLNVQGYALSNYSYRVEDDKKIVWETMQTAPVGTASWRGELEDGKLKGILSLRQEAKEPQDFSFIGIKYWRKQ